MQTTQVSSIISKLPTTYSYVVNTIPNKNYSLKNLKDKITSKTFLSKPSLNAILQNYKKKKVQNNPDTLVLRVKSKSQDNQNSFKTKKPIKQQTKLRPLQNQNEKVCHFKLTIASFDISEKVQMVYEIQLDKID